MMYQKCFCGLVAVSLVCLVSTSITAATVLVGPSTNNGSFESADIGGSNPSYNYVIASPAGWDSSCIMQDSPNQMYNVASQGDQGIALVSYGGTGISIDLAQTFQAKTTYTLSMDANGNTSPGVGGQWKLADTGNTSVEQQIFATSRSSWEAVSPIVVNTALRPDFVGKQISLGLWNGSANQLWLDNVRLTATKPATSYDCPWTNRLMPGQNTFLVTGEGRPAGGLAGLQNFATMLLNTGMGNALAPFYFPDYVNQAYYDFVELNDITVIPRVVNPSMMWYPSADILAQSHVDRLSVLDKVGSNGGVANVSLSEWGYHFYHPPNYAADGYPAPYPGWDPANIPTTKQEAHDFMKAYFQNRVADYQNRAFSVTGHSQYEVYAADWGANVIGLEIGENIAFTQLKFAMARGSARQSNLPWTTLVSSYFSSSHTTNGPLVKTWNEGFGWTATGQDAGHSLSFYKRTWLHSWFAGSALLEQEADAQIFYSSDAAPYPRTPYGDAAHETFEFMWGHDRGVAYTPAVIVMDKYAGYNSFEEGAPWGLAALKTAGDQKLADLFEKQLFPGSDVGLDSPYRAATLEESFLVCTPYGEMFDVLLSSAPSTALSTYKEIILAGDMTFDESFISQLELALTNGSNVMLKQEHITAMGSTYYNRLTAAGDVETLSDWTNPVTGRDSAISNERLQALSDEWLPIDVQGDVQYEINLNDDGWVIELVNNAGVTKLAYEPVVIDPNAVVEVTLTPMVGNITGAELWMVGQADQALALESFWTFTIDPGETIYVQLFTGLSPVPEPGGLVLIASVMIAGFVLRRRRLE